MRRLVITVLSGLLFGGIAAAQSDKDLATKNQATGNPNLANGRLPDGATITATLTKTVDSDKLKNGDQVTARTTAVTTENGKTVIPADSIIRGHVTQASARQKGDSFSTVGILFDKAVLKNGEEMPINVSVQAIALPATAVNGPGSPGTDTVPSGPPDREAQDRRPAAMPSSQATVPDTVGNTGTNQAASGQSVGSVKGGLNDNGMLKPDSRGVYGLRGIGLATSADGQQAAVITSMDKSVRLESGTQLLLITQPAGTQTSTK
jgi:hypothetical protein